MVHMCATDSSKQYSSGFEFLIFYFSYHGCYTKAEEPSLPFYLSIAEWRIKEFMAFQKAIV